MSFSRMESRKPAVFFGFACILLAQSFLLAPLAEAKKAAFQMPVLDKLMDGSGPTAEDNNNISSNHKSTGKKSSDLSPIGINDDAKQNGADGAGMLKVGVTKDDFAAKDLATNGGDGAANGESQSLITGQKSGNLGNKVLNEARGVGIMPLALQPSEEEAEKKAEAAMDADKQQLSDLWAATISRNQDIQFVIDKLQPNSDQRHALSSTMKTLGGALFGVANMAPLMFGGVGGTTVNYGAMMGTNAGISLIQSLFQQQETKNAKKVQISQEQATMLYKIVRDTADKLVTSYRNYKRELTSMSRAQVDYDDLQAMVAESRAGQDPGKQIEMEYILRKSRRDIDDYAEKVRLFRNELVDFAGGEALAKLDQQMEEEQQALARLTGGDSATQVNALNPPINTSPHGPRTASTEQGTVH